MNDFKDILIAIALGWVFLAMLDATPRDIPNCITQAGDKCGAYFR